MGVQFNPDLIQSKPMTASYAEFLRSKAIVYRPSGMAVEASAIHPMLFPFQRDMVAWAVRKGRCAVFADTGLGKTLVQLEWARLIGERTLIVAPLSVARQTVREARKIGMDVHYTRDGADVTDGINITNYEMVDHFQAEQFGAVVLDESSILKCLSGATRRKLTEMFADTPYRLCCTATPAPNDITELGNHAEFLGVCTEAEMRAMFFINANKEHTILDDKGRIFRRKGSNKGGQEWRLKHPAEEPFFRWLASWAICMTKPSDLGYEDDGFILPPLNIYPQFLRAEYTPDDQLFFTGLHGIADRHAVRRKTLSTRIEALAKLVHTDDHSGIRSTSGETTQQMRDMRLLGYEQSEQLPSGRPLPQNGESQRSSLPELQPSIGEVQGQARSAEGGRKVSGDQWVIWCGLDAEQRAVEQILGDACVSIYGSLDPEEKERRLGMWLDGSARFLVSKSRVCGFGLNLQCAANMVFLGLNDSWEMWYQCIRREWRYGQTRPVNVHVLMSDIEAEIYHNVMRKDAMAARLRKGLIEHIQLFEREELAMKPVTRGDYVTATTRSDRFTMMLGDSCERLGELDDNSIDLQVSSPPFSNLFCYSNSSHDLGNSRNMDEFAEHYRFIIREVLRVTKPGRLSCVHTSDIPAMQSRDGYIGVKDFPGEVIRAHEAEGWTFVGRAMVQKNPQALRDGTPVLTPNGWVAIEQLEVGDAVIGSDGKPTEVVDVPFHGVQPIYRVTFDDGMWVECGPEHLWSVRSKSRNAWKTRRTDALCAHGTTDDARRTAYEVPIVSRDPDGMSWFPVQLGETRRIMDVTPTGEQALCTCISVAAPDGLFVTTGYVLTHNSQAIRVKSKALLFVQLRKDSADSRPAMIDQVLIFKKPGENAVPIVPVANGEMDNETWIEWAHGIWLGISESDTLQFGGARGADDEKHVCPLQLGTIERCVKLYSNPGETVLSPFAGIGSEGYVAIKHGRKFIGCELKPEYYEVAVNNLTDAESQSKTQTLWTWAENAAVAGK